MRPMDRVVLVLNLRATVSPGLTSSQVTKHLTASGHNIPLKEVKRILRYLYNKGHATRGLLKTMEYGDAYAYMAKGEIIVPLLDRVAPPAEPRRVIRGDDAVPEECLCEHPRMVTAKGQGHFFGRFGPGMGPCKHKGCTCVEFRPKGHHAKP